MAQAKKNNSSSRSRSSSQNRSRSTRTTTKKTQQQDFLNDELKGELVLIVIGAFALALFLCNFRILGNLGNTISDVMFGLFGIMAYVFPILAGFLCFFCMINQGNPKAVRRTISLSVLFLDICIIFELIFNMPNTAEALSVKDIYLYAKNAHKGGGFFGGLCAYGSVKLLGEAGSIILIVLILIICLVIITEKSFIQGVKSASESSKKAFERGEETAQEYYEKRSIKHEEAQRKRQEARENSRIRKEEAENNKILKVKEVSGVPTYNFVSEKEVTKERDDIHEINLNNVDDEDNYSQSEATQFDSEYESEYQSGHHIDYQIDYSDDDKQDSDSMFEVTVDYDEGETNFDTEDIVIPGFADKKEDSIWAPPGHEIANGAKTFKATPSSSAPKMPTKPKTKRIILPDVNLLNKGKSQAKANMAELKQTANKLKEVLETFNIKAEVPNYCQGPSVTLFEVQPQTGVKVSKILSLQDDIKLNLAASDIRIEAPIPGKAAIGIEIPNKVSSMVTLRDIIESQEFKNSNSKLSFAVGKNISGESIVADVAKMPHVLIAGATGSGKSVCINTLIMSILYKAQPDEVKFIMIDPKVVELSVYNGIPHLLTPVVTDVRKASASLDYAVNLMEKRYEMFADYGVRDLKGYNEKIKNETDDFGNPLEKMFQLVIIVDELADLMMVAKKEVETSICRLAQKARACGIHIVIATQRPSVDVITGLIKANMPSRVAFAVTSGVDSRTILDSYGAEKLLGKGDMLFYPQGYTKPARIQGCFVSDEEVLKVVEYIKKQSSNSYSEEIAEFINNAENNSSGKSGSQDMSSGQGQGSSDDNDEFFYEAGKLITESGKSSIGMLQRKFKIGFNRAARIMDSLAEAGVVGPDAGTKPRAILMSPEEFENFINNN